MVIQAGRGKPRTRVRDYQCGGRVTEVANSRPKRTTHRSRQPTEADNRSKKPMVRATGADDQRAPTIDKSPILAALSLTPSSLQSRPLQGAVRSSHSHYNFSQDPHNPPINHPNPNTPFHHTQQKVIADSVRWDSQKKKNG